jgi:hypothetical protein
MTQSVPETSTDLYTLTRLSVREDFTEVCRRDSFKTYIPVGGGGPTAFVFRMEVCRAPAYEPVGSWVLKKDVFCRKKCKENLYSEDGGSRLLRNAGTVSPYSSPLELQILFHVTSKRGQRITCFSRPPAPFIASRTELVAMVPACCQQATCSIHSDPLTFQCEETQLSATAISERFV